MTEDPKPRMPAATRSDDFMEHARAAADARLAEAARNPAAVEWAERTAEMLVQRLHDTNNPTSR